MLKSGVAHSCWLGWQVDHSRARLLLDRTVSWLPGVLDADRARFSSCCRPLSPDDVPFVGACLRLHAWLGCYSLRCGCGATGAVNGYSNLFVNIGHGSKGWCVARIAYHDASP